MLLLYTVVCKDQVHPHPTISDGYNNFFQLLYYFAKYFSCPESHWSHESKFLNVDVGNRMALCSVNCISLLWNRIANMGNYLSKMKLLFQISKMK